MRPAAFVCLLVPVLGCQVSPAADPEFSDAAIFSLANFESDREADLAFAVRTLEDSLRNGTLDLTAGSAADRAVTPEEFSDAARADIPHPDRDPALTVPIAVAWSSPHTMTEHTGYPLLVDQTPVEPGSPDHYTRTFDEGTEACWATRDCEFLRTTNDLTKENIVLGQITYQMPKAYRWIDLALPDPSTVPEGEEPINEGAPRWGLVARSWVEAEAWNPDHDRAILQSYSLEIWAPTESATLRMLALWAESDTGGEIDESIISNTTRSGIDGIFQAQDEWMAAEASAR